MVSWSIHPLPRRRELELGIGPIILGVFGMLSYYPIGWQYHLTEGIESSQHLPLWARDLPVCIICNDECVNGHTYFPCWITHSTCRVQRPSMDQVRDMGFQSFARSLNGVTGQLCWHSSPLIPFTAARESSKRVHTGTRALTTTYPLD